jgi:hypothetical protein
MSLSKVNKNVEYLSTKLTSIGNLRKIPVVLTDSKGYYLEVQVNKHLHPENKIVWWWESSQRLHHEGQTQSKFHKQKNHGN